MKSLFILLLLLVGTSAFAADDSGTRYVAKRPSVGLLASPAPGAVILARLTPDEQVTVIGEQAGYVNVRTVSGMEGWMASSDVSTQLPASRQLSTSQARIQELEGSVASLQRQLRNAQAQAQQASAALDNTQDSAQSELGQVRNELEVAQKELAGQRERNGELETRIAEYELAEESRELLAQNAASESEAKPWKRFGIPGLLAVCGALLLLGFFIGYQLKSRRVRARLHGMNI